MSNINTGGPAFPNKGDCGTYDGMTLRDWFAGQALVGLYLADELARQSVNPGGTRTTASEFAQGAYEQADAMLRARDGGKEGA